MRIKSDYLDPYSYRKFKVELLPCDSLEQSDVECATEDERAEYWETRTKNTQH